MSLVPGTTVRRPRSPCPLRGGPGVNTDRPVPAYVPGEHFPFRDA
ncbi:MULTISPECIES: hypothetical protein [unclassified Pseudonocardia]|nr:MULTISPECIES: hypothetical protein [unclassified Pseudonocardia]